MKSPRVHPAGEGESRRKPIKTETDESKWQPIKRFRAMFRREEAEAEPKWLHYDEATDQVALDVDSLQTAGENKRRSKFEMFLAKVKDEEWGEEEEEEKESREEEDDELLLKTPHGLLLRPDPQRPSLLLWDLFLFLLDFLQIYALLQSMSLRWIWPKAWIDVTSWLFLANLDLWDLSKVHSNVSYQNARDFVSTSSQFPVPYFVWVLFWVFVVFLVFVCFVGGKRWTKRRRVKLPYLKRAWIEQGALIIIQILALPVGLAMARLFQCRSPDGIVDSINEVTCWRGIHWLLVIVFFPVYAFFFVLCPVWMVVTIRNQVFAYAPADHETFIRLKETEYANGVDVLWAVSRLYLFSSFHRRAVYFRPIIHILKFLLLIATSALFGDVVTQALLCCFLLFFTSVAVLFLRPHRIPLLNALLFLNFVVLSIDALIGALLAKFGVWNNLSALFTLEYAFYELLIANFCWLLIAVPIAVYIVRRHFALCGAKKNQKPIWPRLTEEAVDKLDDQTKIYTKEVIKARLILDRSMAMPTSFVPIHDLANEIHIVNAFCREAEILRHPLQLTLWDVLDDLIEAHNSASASSLFASSVKPSVRKTAAEFLDMMPALARRLSQRNFDFILIRPTRKRLLLKLYVYSVFRRLFEKVRKKRKTKTKDGNKERWVCNNSNNSNTKALSLGEESGESLA